MNFPGYTTRAAFLSAGMWCCIIFAARKINRLGVTASRKIKGSVRRNRMKRLLRESFRRLEMHLQPGYDIILVGRESQERPDYFLILQEVRRLLRKAGIDRSDSSPESVGAISPEEDRMAER